MDGAALEAQIAELERRRTRALVERDLAVIEALHAPDYELVTPAGRVHTRASYLAAIAAAPFYAAWEAGEMRVRVVERLAVVRYRACLTFASGRRIEVWHTDTWEFKAPAGWRAVWSQATECRATIAPAPEGGGDKTATRRSCAGRGDRQPAAFG